MTPFFREAGSGAALLCFHSNAATSSQWRTLSERLSERYRVIAVDALGAGKSPAWPPGTEGWLDDELELLQPLVRSLAAPLHLVGHSYGAALALKLALREPRKVASVALYEPTLFAVLLAQDPNHPAAQGIRDAAGDAAVLVDAGNYDGAAERFIDYWMGRGAWKAIPEARRPAIAQSMRGIRYWANALMREPTPLSAFAALQMPVLYMVGARSPASSRGVYGLLAPVLPKVKVIEFPELGHMGPVTHPQLVDAAIERHLEEVG